MVRGRSIVILALIVAGGWAFTPGCGGPSRAHAPGETACRAAVRDAERPDLRSHAERGHEEFRPYRSPNRYLLRL